jgi:hypothetical protein
MENVVGLCILCQRTLQGFCHRECLLKGLESGQFKSKADWLKQSSSKPKPKKMIRKVLVE